MERDNPLAPALAALMKPGTPQREEWKFRCLKALARFRLDAARQYLLLDCVETYLPLPHREEVRFQGYLTRDREVKNMRKMWSEQLMEKGEKRGVKLGELRARRQTLLELMRAKFGARPASATRLVSAITNVRRLDTLIRRVLTDPVCATAGAPSSVPLAENRPCPSNAGTSSSVAAPSSAVGSPSPSSPPRSRARNATSRRG